MIRNIIAVPAGMGHTLQCYTLPLTYEYFPRSFWKFCAPHYRMLISTLFLTFICSLATGYITALIAASHHMKIVLSTSILILIFGVVMQILSWNTMPVWYHITVLGSLAPLIYLGGTGRIKRL